MARQIKIFGMSRCPHCKCAKDYFDKCGLKFEMLNVDELSKDKVMSVIAEIKELTLKCSFPTIVIDETIIVGFHEDQIRRALDHD
jgi:glutaredoxin-like protein NrdH